MKTLIKSIISLALLSACGKGPEAPLPFEGRSSEEKQEIYERKREQQSNNKKPGVLKPTNIPVLQEFLLDSDNINSNELEKKARLIKRHNGDDFYLELPEKLQRYGGWYWKPAKYQLDKDKYNRLHKVIVPRSALPNEGSDWVFEHFATDFPELLEIVWKEPDGSKVPASNSGLKLPQGRDLMKNMDTYFRFLDEGISSLPVKKMTKIRVNSEQRQAFSTISDPIHLNPIVPSMGNDFLSRCSGINLKARQFTISDLPLHSIKSIPNGFLDKIKNKNEMKRMMLCIWVPLIFQANEEALRDRDFFVRAFENPDFARNNEERLSELAKRYRIKSPLHSEEFYSYALMRADIVPPSLALAQIGQESLWSQTYKFNDYKERFEHHKALLEAQKNPASRNSEIFRVIKETYDIKFPLFSVEYFKKALWLTSKEHVRTLGSKCNNYFSIYAFSEEHKKTGCKASRADRYLKRYDNLLDNVRDYVLKINSHPAYVVTRILRMISRTSGEVNGMASVLGLSKFAEDPLYFRKLWGINNGNVMFKYDSWYELEEPKP